MNGPAACNSTRRIVQGGIGFRAVEWLLLLLGLAALDTYIWISTSSILYQASADWAFDQQRPDTSVALTMNRFGADPT
jgi:hypothetical protein